MAVDHYRQHRSAAELIDMAKKKERGRRKKEGLWTLFAFWKSCFEKCSIEQQ